MTKHQLANAGKYHTVTHYDAVPNPRPAEHPTEMPRKAISPALKAQLEQRGAASLVVNLRWGLLRSPVVSLGSVLSVCPSVLLNWQITDFTMTAGIRMHVSVQTEVK